MSHFRLIRAAIASAALTASFVLAAATPVAAKKPTVVKRVPPVPLLWKVSDKDNSLYLLGSFHLLKPDDYPLSPDVDAAFADAEALMFEIAPQEMGAPELMVSMLRAGMRESGTLNDDLSEQTQRKLQAWAQAHAPQLAQSGMNMALMQHMEPWYIGLLVGVIGMQKEGMDAKYGLDLHFSQNAEQADKPTTGLETAQQQISFLDGMSRKEQAQLLDEALTQANDNGTEAAKLHSAWRAGDVETLWTQMALQMKREYPELFERINTQRNDAWIPKLEQRLRDPGTDDVLVVVGALHLLGSDGVVEKLRAKGYTVERICSACGHRPSAPKRQKPN